MPNVLLGVTGSVASILTPELFQQLSSAGFQVKVVATQAALYFFDPHAIGAGTAGERDLNTLILDEDEWPGKGQGKLYQRGDKVLHIELRRWADVLLIAPLDANTLAKLANGLCDNCLTCVWRAWDRTRPVLIAPAMNTMMWEHPLTEDHLRRLATLSGAGELPHHLHPDHLIERINELCPTFRVIPPQSKKLACDDVGIGAMASVETIVERVKVVSGTHHSTTHH